MGIKSYIHALHTWHVGLAGVTLVGTYLGCHVSHVWMLGALVSVVGLLGLGLLASLELFLVSSALVLLILWNAPLYLVSMWGLYSFAPALFFSLYGRLRPSGKPSEKREFSALQGVSLVLSSVTALISWVWPSLLSQSGVELGFLEGIAPGILAFGCASGSTVGLLAAGVYAAYPIQKVLEFRTSILDYWWIVVCQGGMVLSVPEDQMLFGNFLIAACIPFALEGLVTLYKKGKERGVGDWKLFTLGSLGILCGGSLGIVAGGCALFSPWCRFGCNKPNKPIKRRKNHVDH